MIWNELAKDAAARGISIEENARRLGAKCQELGLHVIALASFENFDGAPTPLGSRLALASRWVNVARLLGSDMIQIPASYDFASLALSDDQVIDELRLLADTGLSGEQSQATITFAYEPMAWSVRDNIWQTGLRRVRRVARPNFKLCLDTYHILARVWGDCTTSDGKVPYADQALQTSLHELSRSLHAEELAFVQLSDGERMDPPLLKKDMQPKQHYSQHWCMWGRLFPYERDLGAYFPMEAACRCLLRDIGWVGWVSMETFHREMSKEELRPEHWAQRGVKSWNAVIQALSAC
jgi:sugar phosphate isomerase/epimerase